MADDNQPASTQNGSTSTVATAVSPLVIPADVAQRFPELVEMIQASRSMNDEERQYWVDALSIMSEEQIKNLYGILENEKKQIQAAEENYKKSTQTAKKKAIVEFDSVAYREKKFARLEAEKMAEQQEQVEEESLLAQLDVL